MKKIVEPEIVEQMKKLYENGDTFAMLEKAYPDLSPSLIKSILKKAGVIFRPKGKRKITKPISE